MTFHPEPPKVHPHGFELYAVTCQIADGAVAVYDVQGKLIMTIEYQRAVHRSGHDWRWIKDSQWIDAFTAEIWISSTEMQSTVNHRTFGRVRKRPQSTFWVLEGVCPIASIHVLWRDRDNDQPLDTVPRRKGKYHAQIWLSPGMESVEVDALIAWSIMGGLSPPDRTYGVRFPVD